MADSDLTRTQRIGSACVGALATSILVTPLDVIKTRQQAAMMEVRSATCGCAQPMRIFTGLCEGELWCYHCNTKIAPAISHKHRSNGTFSMFSRIVQQEGGWRLWRGLTPTLAMSVPSTVLYFNSYDELSKLLNSKLGAFTPAVSGIAARLLAVTVVAPIELVRTRTMAKQSQGDVLKNVLGDLAAQTRTSGWTALFRGLFPTLWRDVPFSGIYWTSYEIFKKEYSTFNHSNGSPFLTSFFAGASAGMLAAVLTQPFDVVKTREQVEAIRKCNPLSNISTVNTSLGLAGRIRDIYVTEGPRSLFVGLGPRLSKVAPACAIMISTYELFKSHFSNLNSQY